MMISITKGIIIDFKELAAWIMERVDSTDIAEHIADENGVDYTYASNIASQIDKNADEFWDSLYEAIIEYCKEQ